MPVSERMQKLQAMLEREPNDTFLLYGVAMEHKKAGEHEEAIRRLRRVLELDPGYCYAYHQLGMIYEDVNEMEAARQAYREGIEAATKKGDAHAREEIQAALMLIE